MGFEAKRLVVFKARLDAALNTLLCYIFNLAIYLFVLFIVFVLLFFIDAIDFTYEFEFNCLLLDFIVFF